MSHIFRFSRWLLLLPPGHCTTNHGWNLSHSRFRTFFGKIMMYFRERDVITMGIPPKMGESLWFCSGTCIPIPYSELTIPVLFKTWLKYRFHPLCPPLPHPPCPTLLAPNPLPLSTTPPPNNFAPLPKVNRWLKIVNYFTCMQHFFCRW